MIFSRESQQIANRRKQAIQIEDRERRKGLQCFVLRTGATLELELEVFSGILAEYDLETLLLQATQRAIVVGRDRVKSERAMNDIVASRSYVEYELICDVVRSISSSTGVNIEI